MKAKLPSGLVGLLIGIGFCWGCGQDHSLAGQVVFVDPDQIEAPGVLQSSDAVVKLELYGHSGTGFFISGSGYLLTNHHVAGREVCARQCPGLLVIANQQRGREQREYRGARLIFSDQDLDLALLKVNVGSQSVAFIRLGEGSPDDPVDQQWPVYVVGHPFAALKKATQGTIDFRNDDVYFIDGFVFPGNSGSPLLAPDGEALGLVMAIYYWIGDIDLKGQYGDSGMATTAARILEKYPFLLDLNVETPPPEAEEQMDQAVAGMDDGLPIDENQLMALDAGSLVRGNAEMLTSLLAHLDEDWVFDKLDEIWARVSDQGVFEETHRYDAARALCFRADTPEKRDRAFDLLSAHAPESDPDWEDSYLWLIHQLGGDRAVDFSQTGLVDLYAGYRLSPVLASILLAFGIRTLGSVDLLDECERLFDDPAARVVDYLVADYLDRFRFESASDEARVVGILKDILDHSDRVRARFNAELALYHRGMIGLVPAPIR